VAPLVTGGYRNHCPVCLWSRHVDVRPGDRASTCHGLMEPAAIEHRRGKGMVIVHRCQRCGFTRPNRVAVDPVQGDEIDSIIALIRRTVTPGRRR
jgi:hypothetical protein